MTPEERARIYSNDYADLLIEYSGDQSILDSFQDATIHIINDTFAVVRVPVSQITGMTIVELGYSVIPSCFGPIGSLSIESSGISKLRNVPNFNLRGQGVLVGIIDSGIDYTNPIFTKADNTTRIVSIWDQSIDSDNKSPENTYYGTEYSASLINQALKSNNPREIVPTVDEVGHGTMLAGIAAGKEDPDNNFYGVATDSEYVIVKLKEAKENLRDFFMIPDGAVCYQENDILFGLEYVSHVALKLKRPIAICVALGTAQGAHDGRGSLSNFLSILGQNTGVGIVVAAGNEGNAKRHYFGMVDSKVGYDTVELNVGQEEKGFSMELWGTAPSVFSIDILSPTGESIPRIPARLDENKDISFIFEKTIIHVDYQMVESQSGDQLILMRFSNPTPGIWRFRVYRSGDLETGFHIWLPMERFISNETFFIRSDPETTVLSLGNAVTPITLTAYNYENESIYLNASKGYSRINMITPTIAAPGVNVVAPLVGGGFASFTGTSVAAAHTAGVVAMMLEWGIVKGNFTSMDTVDIKNFLIRGAIRSPNNTYPNKIWGYGILDIFRTFDALKFDV